VAAFAACLKDAVDLDSIRENLAHVVQQALEPAHVSVWISRTQLTTAGAGSAGPARAETGSQAGTGPHGTNWYRPTRDKLVPAHTGQRSREMARQTSIIASAVIPVSPERVWEIACDTSRYPEWVENTLRMIHTDGPARAGATMEELTRIAGPWKSVTRWRVTEFDPPRRQVQEGEGVSTATSMAVIIELSPAGQDTNFTLTIRYTPRFGLVGALIDRAVRGSITRSQQRSARAFAALVARENSSS
jgi:uncharacterized protein YndB with AHSA1/START domain